MSKKKINTREGQRKKRHARVRKKVWGTAGPTEARGVPFIEEFRGSGRR